MTGCWTDVSDPLPSPVEPGAFLVRFLRDQQDCVIWYLYLRPSGEVFVVHSWLDDAYEYEARRDGEETQTDLDDLEEKRPRSSGVHLRSLNGDHLSGLEPEVRDYLRHYAPPGTRAGPVSRNWRSLSPAGIPTSSRNAATSCGQTALASWFSASPRHRAESRAGAPRLDTTPSGRSPAVAQEELALGT